MSNRIFIVPRVYFYKQMQLAGITDENVELNSGWAFISIQSTKALEPSESPYFKMDHENVLTLTFDDITDKDTDVLTQYKGSRLFDTTDAKKIISFVEKNKDRKFLIHCTAGISRSGAVGTFIQRVLGIGYKKFLKDNPNISPNAYVLSVLMSEYRLTNGSVFGNVSNEQRKESDYAEETV